MMWWPRMAARAAALIALPMTAVPATAAGIRSADTGGAVYRVSVDSAGHPFEDCAGVALRDTAFCGGPAAYADILFVDAMDRALPAQTMSFSLLVADGATTRVSAYDAAGQLLGTIDPTPATGDRITLSGLGQIARIAVRPLHPAATARLTFADVGAISRVPEPASWAMLLTGFALTAAAIRRRIKRSEARFTARMKRIAAGEGA